MISRSQMYLNKTMLFYRVFFYICTCFILFSALPAGAQNNLFDPQIFDELGQRAEQVIIKNDASNSALSKLRRDLIIARTQALNAQQEYKKRVNTLEEQLAVLQKPIADTISESPTIIKRYKELETQLIEAQVPLFTAEEAYKRASGLISEIDANLAQRRNFQLFSTNPLPLNPQNWFVATDEVISFFSSLLSEIKRSIQNPLNKVTRQKNAALIIILAIVGVGCFFPLTSWFIINRARLKPFDQALQFRQKLLHIFYALGILIAPIISIVFFKNAFVIAEITGMRTTLYSQEFFNTLIIISVTFSFGILVFSKYGFMKELFPPSSYSHSHIWFLSQVMGGVIALQYFVDVSVVQATLSDETKAVLHYPLILIGGYALWRLCRVFMDVHKILQASEENFVLLQKVVSFSIIILFLSAISGVVLATIGYGFIGGKIIYSTILSVATIVIAYVIYRYSGIFLTETALAERSKYFRLVKVFLIFSIILFSLPVLAIIWGARLGEIQDIWLILRDGLSVGNTRISFSDFMSLVIIFVIGYSLIRMLQSALRTAILPHTQLDIGAQNALVTGFGYVGIFLAALIAIISAGIDLSKIAIVAGALSVGIGFGLQAIVSNFVSGIILLIERPIKLGDWVEVGSVSGNITNISVRSTTIQTFDKSDVIIPNADFISNAVTNYTLHNNRGRIKIPVSVAYDCNPDHVIEILTDIIANHPMVAKSPKPIVLFLNFGASALEFEMRGILYNVDNILTARSDINLIILKRFREAGIEIPFNQHDIYIKNMADITVG